MADQKSKWTTIPKKSRKTRPRTSNDDHPQQRGRRFEPIPDFESKEEEERFLTLKKEIPHIMMPGHIRRIARKINIDALSEKVLSDEWIAYQREGWEYVRVVKPDDMDNICDDDDHDILPLDNGWGDVVLFRKV